MNHRITRLMSVNRVQPSLVSCLVGLLSLAMLPSLGGCQTTTSGAGSRLSSLNPFAKKEATETSQPVVAKSGGNVTGGNAFGRGSSATRRLVGFVTGKKEDLPRAKALYQQGDALFRKATSESKANRTDLFADAAELFKEAGEAAPESGLHQDALFMQGESQFFANDLTAARDTFETLQKKFPRNRHSDRAAARLFAISKYWIDVSRAGADSWYQVNLFDSTRPWRDAQANAIKVLDQIRYDDPTGKLADDATMAAAAEHIRNERYEQADEFLTDLRETFTDSDHMFLAHLLGIRCKLEIYKGPVYSDLVLEEADQLVKQTRQRFPDKLREEKYSTMLARAAAEISYHQAAKLAYRANYRRKQHNYGAARELYQKLLRDHPDAPQAEAARETLAKIDSLPSTPDKPLSFMTKVFPSAKQSPPLVAVKPERAAPSEESGDDGERMLR